MTRNKLAGFLTAARVDRLAAGIPARRLAQVANVEASRLSRAERGLLELRPEERARLESALEFCRTSEAAS